MSQYKIEAGTGQHLGDRKEQQDRFTDPGDAAAAARRGDRPP